MIYLKVLLFIVPIFDISDDLLEHQRTMGDAELVTRFVGTFLEGELNYVVNKIQMSKSSYRAH